MKRWVEKESKGRMKLKLFSGGQVVSASQSFANLKAGAFEMSLTAGPYHAGMVPVGIVQFSLPMGPRSEKDLDLLHKEYGVRDILSNAYGEHGVKYLTHIPCGGSNVLSKKPIRTLEDFRGLKIRSPGSNGKFLSQFGASLISTPGGEAFIAFQSGMVDALTWSNSGVKYMNLGDVANYMIAFPPFPMGNAMSIPDIILLANQKAFDKLPADLQMLLVRLSEKLTAGAGKAYSDFDQWFHFEGGKKKYNMEVIVLSQADTDRARKIAVEKVWPKLIRDKYTEQYVEAVKLMLKEEGELK